MRVAIVGAGVAGASCAWKLLQDVSRPVALTLFEMGRGAGGRASTRRSRELPGLGLNHGAPMFHIRTGTEVAQLVTALKAAEYVSEWHGTAGHVDAITGTLGPSMASRGEPLPDRDNFARYAGRLGMSSLADGILRLAGVRSANTRYGTKVNTFRPRVNDQICGWELLDREGNGLGEFDWVVVTSASLAHPRWRQIFGDEPPLQLAAKIASSAQLTAAVESIEKIQFTGVHVAMLVWEVGEGEAAGSPSESLRALPFDITEVTGDEVLAKVVRQSLGPPYAAVLLHSTAAFAERHAQVFSSTGTAALMGAIAGSSMQEGEVAGALHAAFERLLCERLGAGSLPAPTWGPVLHRWGSAFPEGDQGLGAPVAWVLPEARVAFAGDYLAPPYACVETAMRSGVGAAEQILDNREGFSFHNSTTL